MDQLPIKKKKEYENKNKIFLENIETINFDYDFIANRETIIKNKTDLEIINYKNKKILEIVNERT